MRTKTLLLTAALVAGGVATSMAQTVYSVNAVGYVNVTIPKKAGKATTLAMIANPLNGTNNLLSTVIPNVPDSTFIYKFNSATQRFEDPVQFFGPESGAPPPGIWFPDTATLNPGEGAFIIFDNSVLTAQGKTAVTLTFVGEVPQGNLTNNIPINLSIKSSIVPQAAGLDAMGLVGKDSDVLYFFNRTTQTYSADPYTFFGVESGAPAPGIWFSNDGSLPASPTPAVGESFWYIRNPSKGSSQWVRTFSVNS